MLRCVHWNYIVSLLALGLMTGIARADLFEYVERPDPTFAWKVAKNDTTDAGTVFHIELTSQEWRGIPWKHQLRLYQPKEYPHKDHALLFITGGSTERAHRPQDDAEGFALAQLCGARVAVLPQVPNQPLWEGRYEDDLIAETFLEYLRTGEADLPLLQPMVKSAIKAMDAVQELAGEQGKPVEKFIVTGASKRGWTTWLTGAVDNERVAAIAPMVIPTLSMKAQSQHQLDVWGEYSEQIADYTRRGLTESFDTPEGAKLWKLVDPFFYLDRISQPVLQINGTNDRYWTLDSMNLYWNDIRGPSFVVYLPNAGHGLQENREYALHGIGAFFRHVATETPLPQLSWTHSDTEDGDLRLTIKTEPPAKPKSFTLWVARSDNRDFRESTWERLETVSGEDAEFVVERPEQGFVALLGDVAFEINSLEYHLSTQVRDSGSPATP